VGRSALYPRAGYTRVTSKGATNLADKNLEATNNSNEAETAYLAHLWIHKSNPLRACVYLDWPLRRGNFNHDDVAIACRAGGGGLFAGPDSQGRNRYRVGCDKRRAAGRTEPGIYHWRHQWRAQGGGGLHIYCECDGRRRVQLQKAKPDGERAGGNFAILRLSPTVTKPNIHGGRRGNG
jgi:hypothetical protein